MLRQQWIRVLLAFCSLMTILVTNDFAAPALSFGSSISAAIPVQSGYDGNEQFCGTLGKIQYVAIKHQVHFNLILAKLKANRQYSIVWQNNRVRGYTVGVFSTDNPGAIRKGSLRMFGPGEVRGIGVMIYYLNVYTPVGIQRFKPC